MKTLTNQFFDINKFPPNEGMIVFPISMSRISNDSQCAKTYWKYIEHFNPSKIDKSKSSSKVGAIFIYTDFLYLYSDEKGSVLKANFMNSMHQHKNSFTNIIKGHPSFIHHSVSYKVWSQFYIDNEQFITFLERLKEIYKKDKKFQDYVKHDFEKLNNKKRKLDESQINFFLEEHIMVYLISKKQMKLENEFINGKEKWVFVAYPGKPLKAQVYLHQKNFFKLEAPENYYQDCWYDLEEKKLYDFNRIDLDTVDL
jgi:hypothetical protein